MGIAKAKESGRRGHRRQTNTWYTGHVRFTTSRTSTRGRGWVGMAMGGFGADGRAAWRPAKGAFGNKTP